jgi:thiosulfate dehydrogenase
MKRFLLGLIIGILVVVVIVPLLAILYVRLGYAPVATASPPLPFEEWLAKSALRAAISRQAPKQSPVPADDQNLLAGAKIYQENCAVCHGLHDRTKTAIAKGMFPMPPQFFRGDDVSDDPVGVTYWKVANGIRLTGMPAFKSSFSETQLWQVSQLLAHTDELPAEVGKLVGVPDKK